MHRRARDSAGLGPRQRRANLCGRIMPSARLPDVLFTPNVEVVLIDDVLTTGATAAESIRVLAEAEVGVRAVLVTCVA